VPDDTFFGHHWYVACNKQLDAFDLANRIDQKLKELNDDYEVERRHALRSIKVDILSEDIFMKFMTSKGKVGGQHKFPRVLKGKMLEDWTSFLKTI
jgi:hypothetical protein